ncbi:lactadherin-like [Branchiostoma lanceolatum]|uniref:lactadherin-like n=1 Tax=Branchiostoma lanceolatum TaxID=7740 RepID=UPI003452A4D7
MSNCRPQFFVSSTGNCFVFSRRPHHHSVAVLVVMVASLLTLTDALKSDMGLCITGVCLNGGTPREDGTCLCPENVRGTCCEAINKMPYAPLLSRTIAKVPICVKCFHGGTRYYSNVHAGYKCLCPPYHDGTCCEVQEGSYNSHAQMYLWMSVATSGIVLLLVCLCVLCVCKRLD